MRHAQTLNEAQFRKVMQYCKTRRHVHRDTTIFMVSFYAGLRAKEIAALKLDDIRTGFDIAKGYRIGHDLDANIQHPIGQGGLF